MERGKTAIYTYILILSLFTLFFIIKQNYEFLLYTFVLGALIFAIAKSDKIFHYPNFAKWGLTLWLFLHLSGGSFYIGQTKLYDFVLIKLVGEPYNILRYDQLIHFYCYIIITLLFFPIVLNFTKKNPNKFLLGLTLILSGVGIGAINEIIEFSTVALFGATGVGDYTNNALDLVFNLMGVFVGTIISLRKI